MLLAQEKCLPIGYVNRPLSTVDSNLLPSFLYIPQIEFYPNLLWTVNRQLLTNRLPSIVDIVRFVSTFTICCRLWAVNY